MNKKYSNGYIPKIKYWTVKLLTAETQSEQEKALNKINYFKGRQEEVYGSELYVGEEVEGISFGAVEVL